MRSILLLEDNIEVQNLVKVSLEKDYHLSIAEGIQKGKEILSTVKPDLIILDVGLVDGEGFNFCTYIRTHEVLSDTSILFLTGRGKIEDKLFAFKLGADDYLVKPFNPKELAARVDALIRRSAKVKNDGHIKIGDLDLDSMSFKAKIKNKDLDLTPLEFKVLFYLCQNVGQALTRENIIQVSWASNVTVTDRVVDVCMSSLRRKLHEHDFKIESVYGVGYRFIVDKNTDK